MLEKYREMLRLRLGDLDGSIPDPRAAMASLAGRFPGALRELDELPLTELQGRIGSLEAAMRGELDGGAVLRWGPALCRYHALLRGALWAKRWLGGRRSLDEAARKAFIEDARAGHCPKEAAAWTDRLEHLAQPAAGKLTALVEDALSRELGLDRGALSAMLFPYGKRNRPRTAPVSVA